MRYIKLFEGFNPSLGEYEKYQLINSNIMNSLVELNDIGLVVTSDVKTKSSLLGKVKITNKNPRDNKVDINELEEIFNYFYDSLIEYDYRIFSFQFNGRGFDNLFYRDFDYIWNKIVENSWDTFFTLEFTVYGPHNNLKRK